MLLLVVNTSHCCSLESDQLETKMSFFVIVGLFLCIQAPGSSAVTHVFVQKGNDVLLEVMIDKVPQNYNIFFWKFNAKVNLVTFVPGKEPSVSTIITGRVEFSKQNYSLKLKNLQAADSGVYEVRVIGDEDQTLAEYNVTVQDPVSPVEMKVDFVLSSSDSCIVNATCSTADSDISSSFTCVNQTCLQDGGEQSMVTDSGSSLRIYLSNALIICNHSNQISWTENMTEIQPLCLKSPVSEILSICLVKTVVFSVGLIIMVSAVVSVHLTEKCKKQK